MNELVADFHFHSKYSRATSPQMELSQIAKWSNLKGINLVGSADFTHPFWFSALKNQLEEASPGLFKIKGNNKSPFFILSCEISCIYKDGGKTRRVHLNILMPSLESVNRFNERLAQIGNLYSDGRPILGASAHAITTLALMIDKRSIIFPAHIWTPWYSVYGSKSGYDSMSECFKNLTPQIFAVETGLSADPSMCWRVKELDNFAILSNGDSHSLPNLAREANVFQISADDKISYDLIAKMIKEGSVTARKNFFDPHKSHFSFTVEFFPEEGKYHYSGHRKCQFKTEQNISECPICRKPLTLGVVHRVHELADRAEGEKPKGAVPYCSLVQLHQIIAESYGVGEKSLAVSREYEKLVKEFSSELRILLDIDLGKLKNKTDDRIIKGIERVRKGEILIDPGYDGEYGKVSVFKRPQIQQKGLF